MIRKFDNDPKMIESQINLAKARINQTKKAYYLTEESKEAQITVFENQIQTLEQKLILQNTIN